MNSHANDVLLCIWTARSDRVDHHSDRLGPVGGPVGSRRAPGLNPNQSGEGTAIIIIAIEVIIAAILGWSILWVINIFA